MVEVVLVDTDVFSFLMKRHTLAAQYEKHIKGKNLRFRSSQLENF